MSLSEKVKELEAKLLEAEQRIEERIDRCDEHYHQVLDRAIASERRVKQLESLLNQYVPGWRFR